jgi:hypothetical protein
MAKDHGMVDAELFRTPEYTLLPARCIDVNALKRFAATVWPEHPPHRVLSRWWMRAEPECAIAVVHRATRTMAAMCAGRPSEWMIENERYQAVAICDWYVAPEHTGRLIGRRLVRHFHAPDRLMYAFAMSQDAIAYLARLGWVGPYTASLMALPLPRLVGMAHSIVARWDELDFREHVLASPLSEIIGADLDRIEVGGADGSAPHMCRGAREWSWRLSVCGDRSYHLCVACRAGQPVGYVAVRCLAPGSTRMFGKRPAAIVTDLVAVNNESQVLKALAARAAAFAGNIGAVAALATTAIQTHCSALAAVGFLSSGVPVLGRFLERRAPQFMWLPRGPAARLTAARIALTFADSDVDLNL